jgi:RNA polymerase sigma-54 factor
VPDFTVTIAPDGEAIVTLNKDNIPELRVSQTYRDTLAAFSKRQKELSREQQEIHTYTKKKVDDAQDFISLIEHRNRALLSVMQTIVKLQRPFFDDDDELLLRPMVLKDVAEKLNFSTSTVSRVTGSKYVQTAYGVYPLKFFFSSQFTSEEGDDISNRQVKSALLEIVKQEDKKKPLSDEALAAALKEKGLPVARRTVTKYREKLGLPTARLRKE